MAYELSVDSGMVVATTSDILKIDERMEILRNVSNARDQSGADALMVDHFAAQLDCHVADAKVFGMAIRDYLLTRPPCFVGVLVSKLNVGNLNLIRTSLSHISELQQHSRIKCYTKEQLLHRDIDSWRAKANSKFMGIPSGRKHTNGSTTHIK